MLPVPLNHLPYSRLFSKIPQCKVGCIVQTVCLFSVGHFGIAGDHIRLWGIQIHGKFRRRNAVVLFIEILFLQIKHCSRRGSNSAQNSGTSLPRKSSVPESLPHIPENPAPVSIFPVFQKNPSIQKADIFPPSFHTVQTIDGNLDAVGFPKIFRWRSGS